MLAVACVVQQQVAVIGEGVMLPAAYLMAEQRAHPSEFGSTLSVLAAWRAFAAGRMGVAFGASLPGAPGATSPTHTLGNAATAKRPQSSSAAEVSDPLGAAVGACIGAVLPRCSEQQQQVRQCACATLLGLLQILAEVRSRTTEDAEIAGHGAVGSGRIGAHPPQARSTHAWPALNLARLFNQCCHLALSARGDG